MAAARVRASAAVGVEAAWAESSALAVESRSIHLRADHRRNIRKLRKFRSDGRTSAPRFSASAQKQSLHNPMEAEVPEGGSTLKRIGTPSSAPNATARQPAPQLSTNRSKPQQPPPHPPLMLAERRAWLDDQLSELAETERYPIDRGSAAAASYVDSLRQERSRPMPSADEFRMSDHEVIALTAESRSRPRGCRRSHPRGSAPIPSLQSRLVDAREFGIHRILDRGEIPSHAEPTPEPLGLTAETRRLWEAFVAADTKRVGVVRKEELFGILRRVGLRRGARERAQLFLLARGDRSASTAGAGCGVGCGVGGGRGGGRGGGGGGG